MIAALLAWAVSAEAAPVPIPWIDGGTALAALGGIVAIISVIAVFRTGANNRIDAKREGELTRVYDRLDLVEETQGVIVRIAVRAIRQIENTGGKFAMTDAEYEVLEKTRPLGEKFLSKEEDNA